MSGMEERIRQAFRDEALDILSELEASLLQLEEDPGDMDSISAVFRAFHTIKGSGAMSGFDEISRFTHDIENVYDLVRSGSLVADRSLIDLTLRSCDLIREMIGCRNTEAPKFFPLVEGILSSFRELLPDVDSGGRHVTKLPPCGLSPFLADEKAKPVTYRIFFRPGPNVLARGTNPLLLLKELRGLGTSSVVAHTDAVPCMEDLDPELCYLSWEVLLTTDKDINTVRDVFIFVEEDCEVRIDVIDGNQPEEAEDREPEGIPSEKEDIAHGGLEIVPRGNRLSTTEVSAGRMAGSGVKHRRPDIMPRIKVSSRKLDALVNLVGELVTVQARLSQASAGRGDPELLSISEDVERLTEEIRDMTMNVRMLPIGTMFSRFRRLVRDLSLELGKEVEMAVEGADTELDKTVIEKLHDPMVHLIRNCIDHGIESPGVREAAGKKRRGTVLLSARHSGAYVLITVRDDGGGLDAELIRAKAVEKRLLQPEVDPPEKEIYLFICHPGFTTATNVTDVSGRGVGMDVVKRSVESLRGSLDIESEKGSGTAITLRLPLTLAIIDGLLVNIGQDMFVFPLSLVEECVELTRRDVMMAGGRHIANIRGKVVPYVSLREQFMFEGPRPEIEQIVIVKENGYRVGFVVDEVDGQHQTVIKTLGRVFRDIDGISGATILGDGRVALIMDIPRLLTIFEEEEVKRTCDGVTG